MAEEETPETDADETAPTPEGGPASDVTAVDVADADAPDAGGDDTVSATKPSAAERRALDEQRERSSRPSRTAEERDAERRERRAAKAVARRRRRAQEKAKREADPVRSGTGTPPAEGPPATPQHRLGTVVSAKPDKTIVVRIDVARRHRRYEKIVRSSSKIHVHDDANDAGEGDRVRVVECRPLSATKRWRLEEVLERAR